MSSSVDVTVILQPDEYSLLGDPRVREQLLFETTKELNRRVIDERTVSFVMPTLGREITAWLSVVPNHGLVPDYHVDFSPIAPDAKYVPNRPSHHGSAQGVKIAPSFLHVTKLPRDDWDQYWDRIYVSHETKQSLMNFILSMYRLGAAGVSQVGLAQHRLAFLFGPPGTGKTSLCRGVANAVARRMKDASTAPSVTYIELDAYQLSSELLGKGPKQIQEAFAAVASEAASGIHQKQDGSVGFNYPVVLMLDEVESILTDRASTRSGADPVDVFRSVNTVITEMDSLARRYPNCFVLATSNLPRLLDPAWTDRVDLLVELGVPDPASRARIFADVAGELDRAIGTSLLPAVESASFRTLVEATEGWSGRALRKLTLQALLTDRLAEHPEALEWADLVAATGGRSSIRGEEVDLKAPESETG